jgi:hypothetical protein
VQARRTLELTSKEREIPKFLREDILINDALYHGSRGHPYFTPQHMFEVAGSFST